MNSYVPIDLRREIREYFANCCAYCRTAERLTVAIFEIEHITPRSDGGETVFGNLCLACPTCNQYKANRTRSADPVTQQDTEFFHPHRDAWTDHFVWNEEGTEITAFTATGRTTIAALRMNRPQLIRVRRMWVAMEEHPPEPDDAR